MVSVLVALALAAACARTFVGRAPDLAGLYNPSAGDHGPHRNPIVLIPGITGSRLVDRGSGRTVWGTFTGDYARPNREEDARLIALPMEPRTPLAELRDGVEPQGVVDRVRVRMLGLPIEARAYLEILASLGVGGYRDEALGRSGAVDYGEDHFTCFQFDYDWRRDNVEGAKRLQRFLREKRAYVREEIKRRYAEDRPDIRFDVVAHSMGALLLRYYLRYGAADLPEAGPVPEPTWEGSADFERVILVAPPNAGSLEALVQLVEGKKYGPTTSRYPPALLGTFPAAYQLLPRNRHKPLVSAGGSAEPPGDLFDPGLWKRLGWGLAAPDQAPVLEWLLPGIGDAEERRRVALDHLGKSLRRAERFAEALDLLARPPRGLQLYLIAGDAVATPRRAAVDPAGRLRVVAEAPGDGTVLRSSALMDERLKGEWRPWVDSPVEWDQVLFLFDNHLGLTRSAAFTDNVLFWLLEAPRGPST